MEPIFLRGMKILLGGDIGAAKKNKAGEGIKSTGGSVLFYIGG